MRIIALLFILSLAGLTGYYTINHYPKSIQEKLKLNVEKNLTDSKIDWVEVNVDGRNLTLSGNSPSAEDKQRAYEIASSTFGVRKTTNLIKSPDDEIALDSTDTIPSILPDKQPAMPELETAKSNLEKASENISKISNELQTNSLENKEELKLEITEKEEKKIIDEIIKTEPSEKDDKKLFIETTPTSNEINIKFSNLNGKVNVVATTASSYIKDILTGLADNIKFETENKIEKDKLKKIIYSLSGITSKNPESEFILSGRSIFISKFNEKEKDNLLKEISKLAGNEYNITYSDFFSSKENDDEIVDESFCSSQLSENLFFSKGQIGLHVTKNYSILDKLVKKLKSCEDLNLEIEACPDSPANLAPKNQGLARSVSVANFFLYSGISQNRLNVYSSCASAPSTASVKTINKGK